MNPMQALYEREGCDELFAGPPVYVFPKMEQIDRELFRAIVKNQEPGRVVYLPNGKAASDFLRIPPPKETP